MDNRSKPKGKFHLNGREIRLRGANTMGHLQQCVMKKDFKQLRDDILLAKICGINFYRMTQCPVQSEIYEMCGQLGMMSQTDLPLFGVLRKNQFCEAIRQAREMAKHVRVHPSNICVSYINEPFPNSWDKPHRYLTRNELRSFFIAADHAVLLENPDQVIKPVDGDYDPPSPGLPDSHCYCGWYNGHGVDLGMLHKGYWQKVKPGWHYGCGEFGSEGLDFPEIMRKFYPKNWLPPKKQENKWSPSEIPQAQTGNFHLMWFDKQQNLEDWSRISQVHQAWITKLMAESFRRDNRMNSFALHLLIDAFPSGWMKSVMDFKRNPKPAFFAYRDALKPLLLNIRTDRTRFFASDLFLSELYVCNDLDKPFKQYKIKYFLKVKNKIVFANTTGAEVIACQSKFQGFIKFRLPDVNQRTNAELYAALLNEKGTIVSDSNIKLEIFPTCQINPNKIVNLIGFKGKVSALKKELNCRYSKKADKTNTYLIDDFTGFQEKRNEIETAVKNGAIAIFLELPLGIYSICGHKIEIEKLEMCPRHFVSCKTGHKLVADFGSDDFKFWFDPKKGYVTPLLYSTFVADDLTPILISVNKKQNGDWIPTLAAAEFAYGKGFFRICQLNLIGRLNSNPTAKCFANNLLGLKYTLQGKKLAPGKI